MWLTFWSACHTIQHIVHTTSKRKHRLRVVGSSHQLSDTSDAWRHAWPSKQLAVIILSSLLPERLLLAVIQHDCHCGAHYQLHVRSVDRFALCRVLYGWHWCVWVHNPAELWLVIIAFYALQPTSIQLWQSGCKTCWAARVMAYMQQLGLQDTLDSQQPIWSQRLDTDSIEVAMDITLAAAWSSYQLQHPYRQLGSSHCEGRTLYTLLCYYAQYFLNINSSTAMRHVYHNIPASAWEPVMQIATGRLRLRSVTAHWHAWSTAQRQQLLPRHAWAVTGKKAPDLLHCNCRLLQLLLNFTVLE